MQQIYNYLDGLQRQEIVNVGMSLGLNLGNLSDLNADEVRGEMIRMWLDQRDYVNEVSGVPTLGSLIKALKVHGFNGQVKKIQDDISKTEHSRFVIGSCVRMKCNRYRVP